MAASEGARPISAGGEQSSQIEGILPEDVDLQALAEEVYNLLRRELLIERERRDGYRVW